MTARTACAAARRKAWVAACTTRRGTRRWRGATSTALVCARVRSFRRCVAAAAGTTRRWCGCGTRAPTRTRTMSRCGATTTRCTAARLMRRGTPCAAVRTRCPVCRRLRRRRLRHHRLLRRHRRLRLRHRRLHRRRHLRHLHHRRRHHRHRHLRRHPLHRRLLRLRRHLRRLRRRPHRLHHLRRRLLHRHHPPHHRRRHRRRLRLPQCLRHRRPRPHHRRRLPRRRLLLRRLHHRLRRLRRRPCRRPRRGSASRRCGAQSTGGSMTARTACAAAHQKAWAAACTTRRGTRRWRGATSTALVCARVRSFRRCVAAAAGTTRRWCGYGTSARRHHPL